MSKADQRNVKSQAQAQQQQTNTNAGAAGEQISSVLGTAKTNADAALPGIQSGYSDIAGTGGFDPAIIGQIQGTYSDFAKTGGISDASATAMRNRSAEAAKGTYDVAAAGAERARAATGGYGDTSAAVSSDLARKGSQAASTAVTGIDASIAALRQSGQLAGAGGLVSSTQAQTGNKLAALGGMTNIYGLNENEVNSMVDAIIKNYQTQGTLNNQDLSILTNLANQPGVFDKIVSTIGTIGGAGAGVLGVVKPGGF